MNLRETILKEHSKTNTNKIVKWIGGDKQKFHLLMNLFGGSEYRVTQRGSWVLSECVGAHPELIKPWLEKIIKNLDNPGLHDAVVRNTLRFLQFIEIPEKLLGILSNICFRLLGEHKSPVAVKVFAMTVLFNICKREPELKNELKLVIEELMPNGSAGLRSRGMKILKELEKIHPTG